MEACIKIDPKITAAEVAEYLKLTVQAVHKRIKVKGLKEKKGRNRIYFGHDTARGIINPKIRQLKLATAVVKGGVGKTTLAEALAIRTALYGIRVLCIDVDQQANLTKGLGMAEQAKHCPVMIDLIENKAAPEEAVLSVIPGLDLIPSRLDNVTLDGYMMINRINPSLIFDKIFANLFKNYDLIIFDCPPTLGSTVCASMLCADLVIAPLNPDVYSYEGIEIMDKEIQNIYEQFDKKINWAILLNKFDSRTILSTDYIIQIFKDASYSKLLLKSVIRTSQDFPNMKKKEKTIFDSLKKSTAKEDIDALAREIIGLMQIEDANKNNLPTGQEVTQLKEKIA
jgi:chromosome partitioning protein